MLYGLCTPYSVFHMQGCKSRRKTSTNNNHDDHSLDHGQICGVSRNACWAWLPKMQMGPFSELHIPTTINITMPYTQVSQRQRLFSVPNVLDPAQLTASCHIPEPNARRSHRQKLCFETEKPPLRLSLSRPFWTRVKWLVSIFRAKQGSNPRPAHFALPDVIAWILQMAETHTPLLLILGAIWRTLGGRAPTMCGPSQSRHRSSPQRMWRESEPRSLHYHGASVPPQERRMSRLLLASYLFTFDLV
jgi:hypothetical protein